MRQKWLYEDDVVNTVCSYLERHRYTILQKSSSKVKAIDIIAKSAAVGSRIYANLSTSCSIARDGDP